VINRIFSAGSQAPAWESVIGNRIFDCWFQSSSLGICKLETGLFKNIKFKTEIMDKFINE
jgi:hypothetical protein